MKKRTPDIVHFMRLVSIRRPEVVGIRPTADRHGSVIVTAHDGIVAGHRVNEPLLQVVGKIWDFDATREGDE